MLLWPFGLHMEREVALSYSIFEPQSALGLFISTVLFITAFKTRKKSRFLLFATSWFFITIFPSSNIFPINALIYEHWLYLPSIGFFVAFAWLFERLLQKGNTFKFLSIGLMLLLVFFYGWRTFERNKDWHNPISFYESTIRYGSTT